MFKTLYCIRHGTSEHNVRYKKVGEKAFHEQMDTKLVSKGISEAIFLSETWCNINDIELVIVSPLSRTLKTAELIFKEHNVPIIVLEDLIEHPQHKEICNKRDNKYTLQLNYPRFDFSNIQESTVWNDEKIETHIDLKERCQNIKKWLLNRSETKICIVSHSSFLQMFINNDIKDSMYGMKHCYPYEYIL